MAKDLSASKCILLAVHYASEGNVSALHTFTPSRPDALDPELVLRILLTYLPESIESKEYTTYVSEVASGFTPDLEVVVDTSPVNDLDENQARRRVKKLNLLQITPPTYPSHAPEDLLVQFICHRAYRMDSETGLLNLVPSLVEPFLERSEYLRTWYDSTIKTALVEFEEETLKCSIDTGSYDLAINSYLESSDKPLSPRQVEDIVLNKAMEAYDGASNCNKTRGGMKKANDIISAFRPYFPSSLRFRQATSLIAATHALSYYSLTLQHGVPFQPVSIRVSSDPISLINKVLEQNPRSYTKLDDLIEVGRNLVSAGLPQKEAGVGSRQVESDNDEDIQKHRKEAERRVIFMAIETALREDDFETAYSYIVNRLRPSDSEISVPKDGKGQHARNISSTSTASQSDNDDDISWRAAFLAGRYRPATSMPPSLRLLEQRTELLSLALLLAPLSALTEILVVWRRCEEEYTSLQLSQQKAEEDFDDRADKRQSTSSLPGNFTVQDEGQPAMLLNQKRREMGRLTGKPSATSANEAPMSMFDLTRSAAQAFSKNAWAGRPSQSAGLQAVIDSRQDREMLDSGEGESHQRVRKRDMVANAASGALASGLGWVLGAKPVQQGQSE